MTIHLPNKKDGSDNNLLNIENLVIIGANGSGKTRLGNRIYKQNYGGIFIASQKSLMIPDEINLKSKENAENEFYNGGVSQIGEHSYFRRSEHSPKGFMIDYKQLITLLFAEEAFTSTKFRKEQLSQSGGTVPQTKLDIVQNVWESIITHKKLSIQDLKVELSGYSATEMSDGEKLIFYIIGQVVCAKPNQFIIIDEPENHLHKAVIKKLYNQLEVIRDDCSFIYLTHDIDFASTRSNCKIIWVKSYEGGEVWDYEILSEDFPIPEQLYLEILGSRKPILFIESKEGKIDYNLYEHVFSEYTVKPIDSCDKVIQVTKSFNEQKSFHNIDSYGLIDRDRRTDEEVVKLNSKNIWVLEVAEAENLLVTEGVVKILAESMLKDNISSIIDSVKNNIINFFGTSLESQTILHFNEVVKRNLTAASIHSKRNIDEIISEIDANIATIDKRGIFDKIREDFHKLFTMNDYPGILKVFNLKNALIPNSKVCDLCDITKSPNPTEAVLNRIVILLKQNDERSQLLKDVIKCCISK